MISLTDKHHAYQSSLLHNVLHGFGTKQTGDGRNIEVIQTIIQSSNRNVQSIVVPGQTHSSHVEIIPKGTTIGKIHRIPSCDGVVTDRKNECLTVVTADCVPIQYYDPIRAIIGISHSGWKGAIARISKQVINAMESLGSKPEDISIAIGPSIQSCCYEVYGERERIFRETFGSEVINENNGIFSIDLVKANCQTLLASGVHLSHIDNSAICTSCDSQQWWSFHRDKEIKGEMVTWIMLPE